jgi:hypothetical protein
MPNVRLNPIDTLADLIIYEVAATCAKCGYIVELRPAKLIQAHGGDLRLEDLKRRFKCARSGCGGRAKNVRIRVDTSAVDAAPFAQSAIVKIVGEP